MTADTSLIADLTKGPGSRELSDRMLLACGWTRESADFWRKPTKEWLTCSWKDAPDPSRNLQDAVDLVPAGMFGTVQFGCERMPAPDDNGAELWGLPTVEDMYQKLVESEAPTPALALCISLIKARSL